MTRQDPESPRSQASLVEFLFGLKLRVDRKNYATAGFGLMALKYLLDAGLVKASASVWLSPLFYLAPFANFRLEVLEPGPLWLPYMLVVLTMPFAWVGVSMSVRRAKDAGLHPVVGLLFLVPFVNYLTMLGLVVLPSRTLSEGDEPDPREEPAAGVRAALVGVVVGGVLAVVITAASTLVLGTYGWTLFVSEPFLMGAVSAFLFNQHKRRGVLVTVFIGILTLLVAAGVLLLFAFEGVICLAMAAPIFLPIATIGALLGRELAVVGHRRAVVLPILALPVVGLLETQRPPVDVHPVRTTVEIAAPPAQVWEHVIAFADIPVTETLPWIFRAGVAYPVRARLEGQGVGAVRHCEFSTGAFVEPITVWDPPAHLAFDVVDQPPPMFELSFWETVNAPHIFDGTLRSRRGEFVLEALPDGGTRLTGTTWYTLDMAPGVYWRWWADQMIHLIHQRVLEHIGNEAAGA